MGSEREPDGGVDPAADPSPGPDPGRGPGPEPLYKFGDGRARLRSIVHTLAVVAGAFIAAQVLVLVPIQLLVGAGLVAPPESLTDLPTPVTAVAFGLNFVGFMLVGLAYLRWRGESVLDTPLYRLRVPTMRDLGWTLGGFVLLVTLLGVVSAVVARFGVQPSENVTETIGRNDPQFLLYMIPVALLLNGPAEEFLFRGIVQGLFRDAYGVVPGIVFAAGAFGVVHFLAVSGGNLAVTLLVITVLGVSLGVIYEYSGNLVVPSIIHGLFNALQFGALYADAVGLV